MAASIDESMKCLSARGIITGVGELGATIAVFEFSVFESSGCLLDYMSSSMHTIQEVTPIFFFI